MPTMLRPYNAGKVATVPTLDLTAKSFLGVDNLDEIREIEAHTSKEEDVAKAREQLLLNEACRYGDSLVAYITGHTDLKPWQLIYGTALGIFNLRYEFPDGEEKFDEIAATAAEDSQAQRPPSQGSESSVAVAANFEFEPEAYRPAKKFAELFVKHTSVLKNSMGVSNAQVAFGIGRAFYILRDKFPPEEGGTALVDRLAAEAGRYFFNANRG